MHSMHYFFEDKYILNIVLNRIIQNRKQMVNIRRNWRRQYHGTKLEKLTLRYKIEYLYVEIEFL